MMGCIMTTRNRIKNCIVLIACVMMLVASLVPVFAAANEGVTLYSNYVYYNAGTTDHDPAYLSVGVRCHYAVYNSGGAINVIRYQIKDCDEEILTYPIYIPLQNDNCAGAPYRNVDIRSGMLDTTVVWNFFANEDPLPGAALVSFFGTYVNSYYCY